jgi:hypothetical protein
LAKFTNLTKLGEKKEKKEYLAKFGDILEK